MEKKRGRGGDGARINQYLANIAKRRSRNRHAKPYCF